MPVGRNPVPVILCIKGSCFRFNSETELNTLTQLVSLDEKTNTQNSLSCSVQHLCMRVFTEATPTCNMRGKPGESSYCCFSCHDITLCSSNIRERKFYRPFGVLS